MLQKGKIYGLNPGVDQAGGYANKYLFFDSSIWFGQNIQNIWCNLLLFIIWKHVNAAWGDERDLLLVERCYFVKYLFSDNQTRYRYKIQIGD